MPGPLHQTPGLVWNSGVSSFSPPNLRTLVCLFHRKGFWHHLRASQVPHQPPGELRYLQAHSGGRALDSLPVLQRLLREHLLEGQPRLHQDWRGRAAGPVHWRIQWHFPPHGGQRGLFNPGRKAECLQLWQQPCAAGRHSQVVMGAGCPPLTEYGNYLSEPSHGQLDFMLCPCVLSICGKKPFFPTAWEKIYTYIPPTWKHTPGFNLYKQKQALIFWGFFLRQGLRWPLCSWGWPWTPDLPISSPVQSIGAHHHTQLHCSCINTEQF